MFKLNDYATLFSSMVLPIYIHSSNAWVYLLPHYILDNNSFTWKSPVGCWGISYGFNFIFLSASMTEHLLLMAFGDSLLWSTYASHFYKFSVNNLLDL